MNEVCSYCGKSIGSTRAPKSEDGMFFHANPCLNLYRHEQLRREAFDRRALEEQDYLDDDDENLGDDASVLY